MPGRNAFSVNTDTVAHDLPLAQRRHGNRNWEKNNPARRYLITVELRDEVAALAEVLMENVDPVARLLVDYAEACHARGTLKLKPRLNPKGRMHTLAWEEADGEPTQLPRRRNFRKKHIDSGFHSLKGQTSAYRLGVQRHAKLKSIAEAYDLRLADILTAFFHHSLQAYQDGKLKIRREPALMKLQVKGWSE